MRTKKITLKRAQHRKEIDQNRIALERHPSQEECHDARLTFMHVLLSVDVTDANRQNAVFFPFDGISPGVINIKRMALDKSIPYKVKKMCIAM